jgi:Kef-type K+ transport system membrane component KefB
VGVVLGQSGFGVIESSDVTLSFLAQLGFALVMFVAGTHVPLRQRAMLGGLRVGVLRALGVGVLAAPLGLLIAHLFGTGHAALYAVLIASSSAGIVLPSLGGLEVNTPAGLQMLVQLAVADAACIVALPLVLDPAHAARAGLGAVAVLAVAAVFFLLLWWSQRSGLRGRVHQVSERRGLAMELRVTLTLLFTLSAIAVGLGVSVMLAGFAMGLAMSAAGEPRRVANQTFALTEGFFAPIFFVWLGSSLDLRAIAANPTAIGLGVALGTAALLAHGLMALTRQPLPIALTTAAQLGVPIGAAALGKTMGVLVDGEATAMLLGALITIAMVTLLSARVAALVHDPSATSEPDPAANGR